MKALAKAEEVFAETERTLAVAITRLQEIEEGVGKLQEQLMEKEEYKTELEEQKQLCEERLARAAKLIVGLSDEEERWAVMVDDIKTSLNNAVGDVLLSSGTRRSFLIVFTILFFNAEYFDVIFLLTEFHKYFCSDISSKYYTVFTRLNGFINNRKV